jgi:hypothetical protein
VLAGTVEADLRGETSAAEHLDRIGQLCGFGVTDVMVRIPRHDIAHTLERMQWFGETVIQPMRCRVP